MNVYIFNNNINAFEKIIYSKIQFYYNLIEFYNKCIYSIFDEYTRHFLILITQIYISKIKLSSYERNFGKDIKQLQKIKFII